MQTLPADGKPARYRLVPGCFFLKNPYLDYRRQAEWDDHGEAYALTHEGPHLYITVILPDGTFYLVFYFFNKDGHERNNRLRDYLITVKLFGDPEADFARNRTLAQGRVCNFWGGVYKVFAVPGGQRYMIQIHDNWSFNTIVSGVFVDPVVDPADERPYMQDIPRVRYTFQAKEAEKLTRQAAGQPDKTLHQALGLVGGLERWRGAAPLAFARQVRRDALAAQRLLRDELSQDVSKELLLRSRAECLNWLRLYDERDAMYQELTKQ